MKLWKRQTTLRPDLAGPTYQGVIPLRFERVSFDLLVEDVALNPDQADPNLAHIHIKRRITLPWQ